MQDCKVAAVIGDTPFLHSGKNVLPELVLRNLLVDIFVLIMVVRRKLKVRSLQKNYPSQKGLPLRTSIILIEKKIENLFMKKWLISSYSAT